jgi:hypothetical protein
MATDNVTNSPSLSDKATLLYWLEQFKHKLLSGDYDG